MARVMTSWAYQQALLYLSSAACSAGGPRTWGQGSLGGGGPARPLAHSLRAAAGGGWRPGGARPPPGGLPPGPGRAGGVGGGGGWRALVAVWARAWPRVP